MNLYEQETRRIKSIMNKKRLVPFEQQECPNKLCFQGDHACNALEYDACDHHPLVRAKALIKVIRMTAKCPRKPICEKLALSNGNCVINSYSTCQNNPKKNF